ncbi:MAG: Asp23/Gls24 family envelope stress response protein [Chloroflexota bacterium]|nr:Asp23/Gls24 family envelope stress response protein [Chloroflexota bacterium]
MTEQELKKEEKGRKATVLSESSGAGETSISDEVVASIAGMAAKEIEGVASLGKSSVRRALAEHMGSQGEKARLGVDVTVGKKEAVVDLKLGVIYGFNIPNIVAKVREKVAARLLEITGLVAKEINITVVNVEFPEKKPGGPD